MSKPTVFAALLGAALGLASLSAQAQDSGNPDVERLSERMRAIDADPQRNNFANYERLQARQALDALANARANQRDAALRVAEWRVETAELAAGTELIRREIDQLDRLRADLMVEASRQEAARARAEAERLRVQAQIQAEEAERLRLAAEAEHGARQEVEGVLEGVASDQAARLRAARARQAELERREAELLRSLEED
ncbi:MAG TPA: hypothetical protein H9827_12055 [Candidatus Luteimonas excrementigallinarum]|nr:hypothetical protein [Candidatus Luteimonas excrementigallinarum]